MEKNVDLKRRSRNLSEKKRRDQFNNLINELNSLIDPHFNSNSLDDDDDDTCSLSTKQRKMDKSSVLKCAMEFLKKYSTGGQQQPNYNHTNNNSNSSMPARNDNRFSHDEQSNTNGLNRNNRSLWKPPYITDDEFSVQMLEALDAFILVCEVSPEARIIYSSDALTNLLNYTGTCNSLRHHDYVSLLDLIAPNDRQQIEKLFSDESENELNHQLVDDMPIDSSGCQLNQLLFSRPKNDLSHNYGNTNSNTNQQSIKFSNSYNESSTAETNSGSSLNQVYDAINTANSMDYKSMVVNFRVGLNLTEIKQKRLKRRGTVLSRPSSKNHSIDIDDQLHNHQHHNQNDQQQHHQSSDIIESIQQPAHQPHQQQPQDQQSSQMQTSDADEMYKEIVDERESACGRCQQSIAEQQQQLISEGHREQQEQNQHRQQQQRQQHDAQQVLSVQQRHIGVDKRASAAGPETTNNEDLSNGNDDASQQICTSDENDQPSSGAGSDDASDSNQSQTLSNDGRPRHHHFRQHGQQQSEFQQQKNVNGQQKSAVDQQQKHNARNSGHSGHHHSHKHSSNSERRQKQQISLNNGHQYELVKLMGIFRVFGANESSMVNEDSNHCDGFDDELPLAHHTKRKRYFICIGRLDIPRFSYDLKMIVPPMTSGSNIFHNNQFLSKHTLKWRFLWVDNRAPAIIGYLPFEVLGTSGYDYYHWDDLDRMVSTHEDLMRDGQASSGPYRFLTKGQQWIWLQTKYCIILKPQCYSGQQSKLAPNKNNDVEQQQLQQRRNETQVQQDVNQFQLQSVPRNINLSTMDVSGAGTYQYEAHMPSSHMIDYGNDGNQDYLLSSAAQQQNNTQMESYMTPMYTNDQINYQDGPLTAYGSQAQQQQQPSDDGTITYTVTSPVVQIKNGTKRFRTDQYDQQRDSIRPSSAQLNNSNGANNIDEQPNKEIGSNDLNGKQYISYNQQLICEQQQNEQRRYEKLLKSNDLIKKQSIEAGNSFLSRSLNQFKFILCTHTVIGFDESDSLTSGGTAASPMKCKPENDNNDLLCDQHQESSALNSFHSRHQQQKCHH